MTELPNANYLCYLLKSDKHISYWKIIKKVEVKADTDAK